MFHGYKHKFFRNELPNVELDYKDVFLVPKYSEIESRKKIDTKTILFFGKTSEENIFVDVPVISANMDTVTNSDVAIEMSKAGGIGAMHRFMSIQQNILEYKTIAALEHPTLVSIGVNEESKSRAIALYEAGARMFVIDIAHGHSIMMKKMILWLRETFGEEIKIMAGNVATAYGARCLAQWGANSVKVGVGPGAVCITKNQTGVTFPQFSAVLECAQDIKAYNMNFWQSKPEKQVTVVADGGLTEFGDIAKAIAAGANLVMSGKFFSNLYESPGDRVEVNGKIYKSYRGMASKAAMATIKREEDMATPEGKEELIEVSSQTVASVMKDLKGALQSSMSYSNAKNIVDFQQHSQFGIIRR